MEGKYRKIDLSDWTCFSNRFNSRSYVSSDREWMVKFASNNEKVIDEINDIMRKLACISMLGFFKFIDAELDIFKSIRKRIDEIL